MRKKALLPNMTVYYHCSRVLKLSLFLLFAFVFQIMAVNSDAQKMIIKSNILSIENLIAEIEKQTDYLVIYRNQEIDMRKEVRITGETGTVDSYLSDAFANTDINYEFDDNYILLSRKNAAPVSARVTASNSVQQQGRTVTVVVTDASGAIIGANVLIKGTTIGNITDLDGRAVLQGVPNNAVLIVSYIGYISREVAVGNQNTVNVTLAEDTQALDEVVVVGYGTQQRKDITGSVAVVSTELLQEVPAVTFAEALQGKASGVFITSTGGPGTPSTIRIRGVGTMRGADPLIVVDGVSGVNYDAVNPSDIETIQVLKDASATAIYGAQGANGVIIITTKQGDKSGSARITYNGYVGIAQMANDGYNLLNAWESMEFYAQGLVNLRDVKGVTTGLTHPQFGTLSADGKLTMPYATKPAGLSKEQIISQYGSVEAWEASYRNNGANSWARSAYYQMLKDGYSEEEARAGSDWYKLAVQDGFVQEHMISAVGGSSKGSYSLSVGYSSREGTIVNSYFKRYSLRANTSFSPNQYLTFGSNTNLGVMENQGERGNQGDGGTFGKVYTTQSWVPMYNIGGDFGGSQSPEGGRNSSALQNVINSEGNWGRNFRGQTAIYAEVKPITGLTVRSQFSAMLNGNWSQSFTQIDIMANREGTANNSFRLDSGWGLTWQWTNTATYTKTFNEDHNLTVVVGSEAIKANMGYDMMASRRDYMFPKDPNTWTLDNGSSEGLNNESSMNDKTSLFGLFGRADYSYQGKYLATVALRRDASSRFGANNRWGTFPSLSLGWRMSDEAFMESTRTWLDDMKFRIGVGQSGNSNIEEYNWAFQYTTGNEYNWNMVGSDQGVSPGFHVSNLGDPDAKWETTTSFNVGTDITAFNNKLTVGLEWWNRRTTDMLVGAPWSALAGRPAKPRVNIGTMNNRGVDLQIGWRDNIGAFRYNVSGNISTYRNKVVELGAADIYTNTRLTNISITTNGQPMGMFWGYQVDGIYTSAEDVRNYGVVPIYQSELSQKVTEDYVGRYKFADLDNDGYITAKDKTFIGNPHPDFQGGINVSLGYKQWDLSAFLNYKVGNEIFKHYEFYTMYGALQSNFQKERYEQSWQPQTNPNGKFPMWTSTSMEGKESGGESHSNYVADGSYARLQTMTLGYTLPKSFAAKLLMSNARIYVQASNLFTLTKYPGLEPEVRSTDGGNVTNRTTDTNAGIDYGSYGMPRQFIMGISVSF